jgi:Ca2+-binding RTX toxin-like protein
VVEIAGEGHDTVRAATSYTLSSNIEDLVLLAGGDFTAGGNSLDNHLFGNSGNNILAGGLGADTLEGGLGDDVYVVNDSLDTIIDTGGIDTLRSTLDVVLAADLENIELVGIGNPSATGNGADNRITGSMGDNILDGRGGVDTLTGGAGDDQFVISWNGEGVAADTITDFGSGDDLLVFDMYSFGIDVEALGLPSSGLVAADSFVKGAGVRALDPNDYYLVDTATGEFKFDPDGSGSAPAFTVVKLSGVTSSALSNQDIFVAV